MWIKSSLKRGSLNSTCTSNDCFKAFLFHLAAFLRSPRIWLTHTKYQTVTSWRPYSSWLPCLDATKWFQIPLWLVRGLILLILIRWWWGALLTTIWLAPLLRLESNRAGPHRSRGNTFPWSFLWQVDHKEEINNGLEIKMVTALWGKLESSIQDWSQDYFKYKLHFSGKTFQL